ncbi:hypothetical protein BASA81_018328 [Batrachochytrium salamandrivorans]|nr:hypothetical protein BASA81_018328 [Batrachochytrium salamandrivorans]
MLSALSVFNTKGDVLISRIYRPDVRRSSSDLFRIHVISSTDVRSPLLTIANMTFFHIKHENLFIVAVTKTPNVNACLVYEFLYRIVRLGKSYFGAMNESSVKSNFTLKYAILGFPQNTEEETLKMSSLPRESNPTIWRHKALGLLSRLLVPCLGADPDIKYRKNEALSMLLKCVKRSRFDSDRTINFIPPDGEFELMRYRTTENISLPFKVHAVVNELSPTTRRVSDCSESLFSSKVFAQNIVIKILPPLNTGLDQNQCHCWKGQIQRRENCMVWKIARFQGHEEVVLSAEADLTSTTIKKVWSRPPISLDFQVLMFTASGLMVRFLKIFEKGNYTSVKMGSVHD